MNPSYTPIRDAITAFAARMAELGVEDFQLTLPLVALHRVWLEVNQHTKLTVEYSSAEPNTFVLPTKAGPVKVKGLS